MPSPFVSARWIWSAARPGSAYVLFARALPLPAAARSVRVRIAAIHDYDLYLNGALVHRGPVRGEPRWCLYDEFDHPLDPAGAKLDIAVVVHHALPTVRSSMPSAPGLRAEFQVDGAWIGTDDAWHCLDLDMWAKDTPRRSGALDRGEDYNAALEPDGWQQKRFPQADSWPRAECVAPVDETVCEYQLRPLPMLTQNFATPVRFTAWRAPSAGPQDFAALSSFADTEPLEPIARDQNWSPQAANALLSQANALTLDLGREEVGHYVLDLEAPEGAIVEVSGAELLRDGRPWILRKGVSYSVRLRTRAGRQRFTNFIWSGFRYLHIIFRNGATGVRLHSAGAQTRRLALPPPRPIVDPDPRMSAILRLCEHTIRVGAQEHMVDCPTREQAQYWGDALFIADTLWHCFGEPRFLRWYLDCFLHVPFRPDGQIPCVYPGTHPVALVDYSLVPLIGQQFHHEHTGAYHRPQETFTKAEQLKRWYDARLNADGIVALDFDFEGGKPRGLINFIDHPGIGWHNFPHPGIDRSPVSCPLNTFYCKYLCVLADLGRAIGHPSAPAIARQAADLRAAIRRTFLRGGIFRDALHPDGPGRAASWQTNALAVLFDIAEPEEAAPVMRTMLEGYDRLCRCSPYFHFYFLFALRRAGLESEARDLILREWGPMLDAGATTTWEGFAGDEKDSLCHPWSTAPLLFAARKGDRAAKTDM